MTQLSGGFHNFYSKLKVFYFIFNSVALLDQSPVQHSYLWHIRAASQLQTTGVQQEEVSWQNGVFPAVAMN